MKFYTLLVSMAIEEKNNGFLEESLSSQLEKIGKEQQEKTEIPQAPQLESAPIPQAQTAKEVAAQQEISAAPISTRDLLDDSKESLQNSDMYGGRSVKVKNYNDSFVMTLLGILLFMGLGVLSYLFFYYLKVESTPNNGTEANSYAQWMSETYDEYGQTLGLFDLKKYEGDTLNFAQDGEKKLQNLMQDEDLNYVQKEALFQSAATRLTDDIIQMKEETAKMQEQLNRDGFFPEELVEILKKDNAVGSIQRSLLSLEVVKFTSAMKVFSLMDVFLSDLSSLLGPRKQQLKERFDALIERGERDVKNYLSYCYNNPYEPENCSIIGDFDRYYRMNTRDKDFDTNFFKRLMGLINDKLELSQVPSFSITFNSFDGKSNSIAFTVEVNTLKEDEYELRKQGVRSPHIFIVSELIKLLKQSTFILGKAIDAKDVQVNAKKIEIGWSEYTVNNSVKTFTLPIQKETEREIFDYVDVYQAALDLEHKTEEKSEEKTDLTPVINHIPADTVKLKEWEIPSLVQE